MTDHIEAWRCVGCGRIEAPQSCIGVCRDQKVNLIPSEEYEAVIFALETMREQLSSMQEIISRLAFVTPHTGKWESTYRILQQQARTALAKLEAVKKEVP